MTTKIYMTTLGCPKNQVDSEKTMWALQRAGAELTGEENAADVLLVNTCGFIGDAKEESIDTILGLAEIKKSRPGVKLGVLGCLSQRYRDELRLRIPEIDHIYGVESLNDIVRDLAGTQKPFDAHDPDAPGRVLTTPKSYAYLKIAEGCSNKCSFCVIPSIRGRYRSRAPERIAEEARRLAEQGAKELVLVAQDTTLYGTDLRMNRGLESILETLDGVDGIEWIRVMYMYPPLLSESLIETIAGLGKTAPYFDVPFQHVSDGALSRMNRAETNSSIRKLVDAIRRKAPGAAIRSSFIVGFPGETDEEFETLLDFVRDVRLDHLGVFCYSPEEGSEAYSLPGAVDPDVAEARREAVMETQRGISASLAAEQIGKVTDVLVDGLDENGSLLVGRTRTQAPEVDGTVILDEVEAQAGDIVPVRITGATDYDLIGEPAGLA